MRWQAAACLRHVGCIAAVEAKHHDNCAEAAVQGMSQPLQEVAAIGLQLYISLLFWNTRRYSERRATKLSTNP